MIQDSRFKNSKSGFSLIEMVIALGIFTTVIWATVDIVIAASNLQAKASELRNVHDNIRFAVEYMSKEIRTGLMNQNSTTGCGAPGSLCDHIEFTNQGGDRIRYCLDNGVLMRLKNLQNMNDCDADVDDEKHIHLTSDDIAVQNLGFITTGEHPMPSDTIQPMTTIIMSVSSLPSQQVKIFTSMNLQTTVVQRQRDL